MSPDPPAPDFADAGGFELGDLLLDGVATVFASLGRALICFNRNLRVVHASPMLDQMLGSGAVKAIHGKTAEEVFGDELFGPEGSMSKALLGGDRREGWGATFQLEGFPHRLVSVTGAPIQHREDTVCDPRVAYILVARSTEDEMDRGSSAPTIFSGMLARSSSMLHIFRLVQQLSESDATVLIGGESGTGKELVARAIHEHSPRNKGPFVAVNCGAIPGELLESEMFGHTRGAFTGAVRDRIGRFELAAEGTIFLDEVGDLPLPLQVKLLRVLQEKTFERVGESQSRSADARVIAATNRNLKQAVHDGSFRDDLYYRLRVVPIEIPPLRQRREDIEPLGHHLLSKVGRRHNRSVRLSPDAMRALLKYGWPGNIRELENALEYAMAVSQGQTIRARDFPLEISAFSGQRGAARGFDAQASEEPSVPDSPPEQVGGTPSDPAIGLSPNPLGQTERDRIESALQANFWKRGPTAQALGMSRTTLWRKMREFGLLET